MPKAKEEVDEGWNDVNHSMVSIPENLVEKESESPAEGEEVLEAEEEVKDNTSEEEWIKFNDAKEQQMYEENGNKVMSYLEERIESQDHLVESKKKQRMKYYGRKNHFKVYKNIYHLSRSMVTYIGRKWSSGRTKKKKKKIETFGFWTQE